MSTTATRMRDPRDVEAQAFESVSSWRQPIPPPASAIRTQLIEDLARRLVAIRPGRVRAIVDGYTASGKTSFAHELAGAVRQLGRPTLRATFDDFKKPWREAREQGYDRISGQGFYRNAPDFESARKLLLEPAGPDGSGVVVLCAHDPLTGDDHRRTTVAAPIDAVLIVDSVFGMRLEYDDLWDVRIWLEAPSELALARGIERDAAMYGAAEAERIHRDRYHAAEQIYITEVGPHERADVVVDNTDYARPVVVRW
jgi:uridine kinase